MLEKELVFRKEQLQEAESANVSLRLASEELNVLMAHLSAQVFETQKEAAVAIGIIVGAGDV